VWGGGKRKKGRGKTKKQKNQPFASALWFFNSLGSGCFFSNSYRLCFFFFFPFHLIRQGKNFYLLGWKLTAVLLLWFFMEVKKEKKFGCGFLD
jgi:hypothetical protein